MTTRIFRTFLLMLTLAATPAMVSTSALAADPQPVAAISTVTNALSAQIASGGTAAMPSNETLAQLAGAPDPGLFTVPDTDKSVGALVKIFGREILGDSNTATAPSTGAHGLIASMMETWGYLIMILGVIFLAYIILAGLLKTAHEGEVLGRQWSSIWIPIRSATGYAMILPIVGGFSLCQLMVVWVTTVGIGGADAMLRTMGDGLRFDSAMVVKPALPLADDQIQGLWNRLVCSAAMAREFPDSYTPGITPFDKSSVADRILNNGAATHGFTYGDISGHFPSDTCGGYGWSTYDRLATGVSVALDGGVTSILDGDHAMSAGQVAEGIISARKTALRAASDVMWPQAVKLVNTGITDPNVDFIADASRAYNDAINQNFNAATKPYIDVKIREMNESMNRDGWIFAGAYFMKILHLNNEVVSLAHIEPSDIEINPGTIGSVVGPLIATRVRAGMEYLQAYQDERHGSGVADAYKQELGLKNDNAGTLAEVGATLRHPFMRMQEAMVRMVSSPDQHPILSAQELGNYMIDLWYASQVAQHVPAIKAGAKMAAIFDGIKDFANKDSVAGTFSWITNALIVSAIILAVVLPLMPFIIWMIDVLGWLMSVVVAVIAAPVWMVMHMHPEGHDLAGHGARGYSLLLSVTMKPALMVMSLLFAMLLSWVSISLVAEGWMFAFAAANSTTIVGPIIGLGGMVMFCIVLVLLVYKSFSLIHGIQNEVLQWIGGRDHDLVGASQATNVIAGTGAMMAQRASGWGASITNARRGRMEQEGLAEREREREGKSASLMAAANATAEASTSNHSGEQSN